MANLTCPGCGSVYPMSAVQAFDHFTCAICQHLIVVPMAGPSAARVRPAETAQPARPSTVAPSVAPSVAPPGVPPLQSPVRREAAPAPPESVAPRSRVRPTRQAPRSAASLGPNWAVIGVVALVCAAAIVAVAIVLHEPSAEDVPAPIAPVAAPSAPPRDPNVVPAAWKELPSAERAARAASYLAGLDRTNAAALSAAHAFLVARDETESARRVVDLELARNAASDWAHRARGDMLVEDRIELCTSDCTRAEETGTESVMRLAQFVREKKPKSGGAWWADANTQQQLDVLLAAVRADEKRLAAPSEWAVARWTAHQRRIEVVRDHASITGTVGPYLVFVQVNAPSGTPLAAAPEAERARAKNVLEREALLLGSFREEFHRVLGKDLGLVARGAADADESTLLKVNVFADRPTFELYQRRIGFLPNATNVGAYYQPEEPRLLVTYDADPAVAPEVEQAQCREAVRQLLHFSTWDVSRRREGREPALVQCLTRPPWLEGGFADFFASHRRADGKVEWMQPLERRALDLWIGAQVAQKKRWAPWSLDELLSVADAEQVAEQTTRRVLPRTPRELTAEQSKDVALASRVLRPAFEGKSWSLVSFLWNAEDGSGRPKYREGFVKLLEESLHVRLVSVAGRAPQAQIESAADFRRALGLAKDERYLAFEKEWLAWEQDLVARSKKPAWDKERDRVFGEAGIR